MIDVAANLIAVSAGSPCGENLEYDPVFGEMERATVGKPEQQFGKTIVPAEEPNWKDVGKLALQLAGRTKDLRVVTQLAKAELAQSGLPAFAAVLELIRGYVELFWETVHPQLDPSDGNDPILRINTLESLCDGDSTLRLLRLCPIVSARSVGRFNLRDVAVADGEIKPPTGTTEAPDWTKINAAFLESPIEEVSANAVAVKSAKDHLVNIQKIISEKVGAGAGVNFQPIQSVLTVADKILTEQLSKRGATIETAATGDASASPGAVAAVQPVQIPGEINTRDDVVAALDRICDYYAKREPSSPLPLLLQRCKRLVSASFLEIIQEMIPDAVDKAKAIGGQPK
jgi:type VI secretion system protein ImpA